MSKFKRVALTSSQLEDGYLDAQSLDDMRSLAQQREKVDAKLQELETLQKAFEETVEVKYKEASQSGFEDGWKAGHADGKSNATQELLKLKALLNIGFRDIEKNLTNILRNALGIAFADLDISQQIEAAVRAQVNIYRTDLSSQMYVHPSMVGTVSQALAQLDDGLDQMIQVFGDDSVDVDSVEYEFADTILDLSPVSQLHKAIDALLNEEGGE